MHHLYSTWWWTHSTQVRTKILIYFVKVSFNSTESRKAGVHQPKLRKSSELLVEHRLTHMMCVCVCVINYNTSNICISIRFTGAGANAVSG